MENQDFGKFLRNARERRALSVAEVAERTKVSPLSLELMEAGVLDDLPAEVFVRGFIRSYARAVGVPEAEPLGLFEQAVAARHRATLAVRLATTTGMPGEDDAFAPRRGIGLAVFVIIVLAIATITLSLFLRQPPQSGEGLSQAGEGHVVPTAIASAPTSIPGGADLG